MEAGGWGVEGCREAWGKGGQGRAREGRAGHFRVRAKQLTTRTPILRKNCLSVSIFSSRGKLNTDTRRLTVFFRHFASFSRDIRVFRTRNRLRSR